MGTFSAKPSARVHISQPAMARSAEKDIWIFFAGVHDGARRRRTAKWDGVQPSGELAGAAQAGGLAIFGSCRSADG